VDLNHMACRYRRALCAGLTI